MFNWLSNKVLHHTPAPARRTAAPVATPSAKNDEEFACSPSLSASDIEVEELSVNEFLHYFKEQRSA